MVQHLQGSMPAFEQHAIVEDEEECGSENEYAEPESLGESDDGLHDYAEEDEEDEDVEEEGTDVEEEDSTRTVEIDMSDEDDASLQGDEEDADVDFEQLKVAELRDMCRDYELDSKGKKADLVARLNVFVHEMKQ